MKYFFIIGSRKTGTTLLARLLDQHFDIACTCEAFFFQPEQRASIFNTRAVKRRHGYSDIDKEKWSKMVAEKTDAGFRNAIHQALDDFGKRNSASFAGDKYPWAIDKMDIMKRIFPDAKYIYIVRDPRAVWSSGQQFNAAEDGDAILNEMLERDIKIEGFFRDRSNLFRLKFEDLISGPESIMKSILSFLGADTVNYGLEYDIDKDYYPHRWTFIKNAIDTFDPGIIDKWKHEMTQDEITHVTEISKDFIKKYGYGD